MEAARSHSVHHNVEASAVEMVGKVVQIGFPLMIWGQGVSHISLQSGSHGNSWILTRRFSSSCPGVTKAASIKQNLDNLDSSYSDTGAVFIGSSLSILQHSFNTTQCC